MRARTALAALLVPLGMIAFTACPAQDGCYEDGVRVQCGYDDDDDDDRRDRDDDYYDD